MNKGTTTQKYDTFLSYRHSYEVESKENKHSGEINIVPWLQAWVIYTCYKFHPFICSNYICAMDGVFLQKDCQQHQMRQ